VSRSASARELGYPSARVQDVSGAEARVAAAEAQPIVEKG